MAWQKFRKKPVVIEAVRFNGPESVDECLVFIGEPRGNGEAIGDFPTILIRTLEGTMEATPGDWIIRGVKGEFYPCKPDIFEATYEAIESEEWVYPKEYMD